jgi:hypothetical protein
MKVSQLTTRQCMVVVLAFALVFWWFPFMRQYRAYARLEATLLEFEEAQCEYDIGRITGDRFLNRSERLMEAQVALKESKPRRIAAVAAHLHRASEVLRQEREFPEMYCCRNGNLAAIFEAESWFRKAREQLKETKTGK